MDNEAAILALAALAQSTRLGVFRLLVRHEPGGMAAGDIARRLAVPHNTLSSHLGVLARAGLVRSERRGRAVVYRAALGQASALAAFLLKDCCDGRAEACAPVVAALAPCC
ncbi:MAG TPA: metalloregulator ArsR/SmtB family transcription factor [Microvirga sp.]|jgi:DNA-binding transcriptional ArsR family regulator